MGWLDKLLGGNPDKGGKSSTPPMQPQKKKYTPKKAVKQPKKPKGK